MNNMIAVIATGGKQYIVKPKQRLKVELLKAKEGDKVLFDKVLLLEYNKEIKIGTPYVEGVKVEAKLIKNGRYPKITILRYKAKTRHRRKKGHRQHFSEVEIQKINV